MMSCLTVHVLPPYSYSGQGQVSATVQNAAAHPVHFIAQDTEKPKHLYGNPRASQSTACTNRCKIGSASGGKRCQSAISQQGC